MVSKSIRSLIFFRIFPWSMKSEKNTRANLEARVKRKVLFRSLCLVLRPWHSLFSRAFYGQLDAIFVALWIATSKTARVNHLRFCRRDVAEVSNAFETRCNSARDKNCIELRDKNRLTCVKGALERLWTVEWFLTQRSWLSFLTCNSPLLSFFFFFSKKSFFFFSL